MDLDEEDEDDQDFEEDVPEDIDPSSEEEQEEKPRMSVTLLSQLRRILHLRLWLKKQVPW